MESIIRVLIVEDRLDYQKIFMNIVSNRLKYKYEIAASVDESRELLRRYTFQIALIDLSLDDNDHNNRDGFKVLDLLKQLNAGTKSIVLTAYGKMPDADKAVFENYDLLGFIDKGDMDIDSITQRIKNGVEKAQLEMQKPSKSILDIQQTIQGKSIDWILRTFENNATEFNPNKITEMEMFLRRLLTSFTPLIPHRNGPSPFQVENKILTIRAKFWSKALGSAIEMWIGPYQVMEIVTQPVNESIFSKKSGYGKRVRNVFDKIEFPNWGGVVYELTNLDFDEFVG